MIELQFKIRKTNGPQMKLCWFFALKLTLRYQFDKGLNLFRTENILHQQYEKSCTRNCAHVFNSYRKLWLTGICEIIAKTEKSFQKCETIWKLRNYLEFAKSFGKCETKCQGTYMCWDHLRSNFGQFRDHFR